MSVILTKKHFDLIVKHCKDYHPAEAIGLLLGKNNVILGVVASPNEMYLQLDNSEKTSATVSTRIYARAHEICKENKLEIIGKYHSHPPGIVPIPSHADIAHHSYFHYRYMMIISLNSNKNTRISVFGMEPKLHKDKLVVIKDKAIKTYLSPLKVPEDYIKPVNRINKLFNQNE